MALSQLSADSFLFHSIWTSEAFCPFEDAPDLGTSCGLFSVANKGRVVLGFTLAHITACGCVFSISSHCHFSAFVAINRRFCLANAMLQSDYGIVIRLPSRMNHSPAKGGDFCLRTGRADCRSAFAMAVNSVCASLIGRIVSIGVINLKWSLKVKANHQRNSKVSFFIAVFAIHSAMSNHSKDSISHRKLNFHSEEDCFTLQASPPSSSSPPPSTVSAATSS
jgi:hypothetical protein